MEQTEAIPDVTLSEDELLAKVFGDGFISADDVKRLFPKFKKRSACPKCRKRLGTPQKVADHLNEGAHRL